MIELIKMTSRKLGNNNKKRTEQKLMMVEALFIWLCLWTE